MTARVFLAAAALAVPLALGGCGLHPIYAGGGSGVVARSLAAVEVKPIEGKAGWLIGNALRDRFAGDGSAPARYRLDVTLDDHIEGLAVRSDYAATRERRTLRARFQLVRLDDQVTVLDATAGSDAGLDVVGSEYATIAAENSALERLSGIVADQITTRIALYARRHAADR
ncbi:MAG: LPS assembly lipoprotein LptE [Janthinobacterium lividum]